MGKIAKCCEQGHDFQKHMGVLLDLLICRRCGKKVRWFGL